MKEATGQEAHSSSVAPPVCLPGHVSDVDVRACLVPLVVQLEAKALLVVVERASDGGCLVAGKGYSRHWFY